MTLSPISRFGWLVLRLVVKVSCLFAPSACWLTLIIIGTDGDKHSATLSKGQPGVLHGVRTYILQSPSGQIIETHSISAGLDYPGVGPEHAWLKDSGRAEYNNVDITALESAHAVWEAVRLAKSLPRDQDIVLVGPCCFVRSALVFHVLSLLVSVRTRR
jgi:hypothetical protein